MSEMTNFDDFTRKHLENYSPEVPPYIWDNITAKREKKKPYPFLLKFFNRRKLLLIAGLITLLTTSVFILNNHIIETGNKNELSETQLTDTEKGAAINELDKQQNDLTQNTDSPEDKVNNKESSQPENILAQSEISVSKNNTDNFNNPSLTSSAITSSLKNNSQDRLITVANKRNKHIYKAGKINIASDLNAAEEFTSGAITISQSPYTENKNDEVGLISFLLYHPESITANSVKGTALSSSMLPAIQIPPCPTMEKDAAGNKYYIEVYAGPDYASKNFTDTANSVLLQKRKESTSFRSAFSAGFRYTRVFNNGASVRAGINYSQINEKFSYVQSNITQVTYITDPVTGDTTGTFSTSGTRYKTTNNRYHTIDVPLLFGFEAGNGKLHANFNAGVVLNIYSWQKGESLDTSFSPVSITTGKTASIYQYKTNIGAGFMGGISVYYKLNDRFHLLAEPYWRYNFSPMNKEMLSLQEKFSTIGLRLGVRLDLN